MILRSITKKLINNAQVTGVRLQERVVQYNEPLPKDYLEQYYGPDGPLGEEYAKTPIDKTEDNLLT